MSNNIISEEDLVENPTTRVPVCLCLDVSSSMMEHGKIEELNEGIKLFYNALDDDEVARYSAEIAIVTFGSKVECKADFMALTKCPSPPYLKAHGSTPLGEAVNMSLDLLETRKRKYQEYGIDYYQPWLVIMTDGDPNGNPSELERATERTTKLQNDGKLVLFPIGIGPEANMEILQRFSPKRTPLRLRGLEFGKFFAWLSQSVSRTSQSISGEKVPLDREEIKVWAEL